MTELSIVVTAHNRADIVEETLASLAEQEWDGDWDVVLVDNDSSDATLEVLERWADKMPVPTAVVEARDDHNLCYARNAGVAGIAEVVVVSGLDDGRGDRHLVGPAFEDLEGGVARIVVDEDDVPVAVPLLLGERGEGLLDDVGPVVRGDHDRQFRHVTPPPRSGR